LKIAIVTFAAYGAGAQYTAQLANALAAEKQVAVLLPADADTSQFRQSVSLVKLPLPFNLIPAAFKTLSPGFMNLFLNTLDREKPDVVHLVFEHRFPFWYACKVHGKHPFVVTIHEPRAIPNRGWVGNLTVGALEYTNNSLLARCCDRVIVHSEKLRKTSLISKLPAEKVHAVPHGNFSFFSSYGQGKEKKGKNILFFGRIASYKGLEYLIEAAAMIRPSVPGLSVTIAGGGNLSKYAKSIADREFFLVHNRYIPDEEAADLLQAADLVVLPYTDGSQSSLISAAAAFKKPAVVTSVGDFADMVEDGRTGLVVPPRNSRTLAEAILKLLNNDELRTSMGENAYCKMQGAEYSWDTIAAKTITIYNEAIASYMSMKKG
jgi:glycosyltransferase involved in cell wall biosynthesis